MRLYQLLIRVLSPLILLLILVETIKRKAGTDFFLQRLGLSYPPLSKSSSKRIWLHCASVGEVKAAESLIRAIEPQFDVLITTNTPTGKAIVETLFAESVEHRYLPMDWPFAIRRFLKACQPSEGWILETEIWPNLYRLCQQQQTPITIINGRISRKTLNAPAWLKEAYKQSLQRVTRVLARSQAEAERFIGLGANPSAIVVIGNLKFAHQEAIPHYSNPINRDYILLASSHADEELNISQAWLKQNRPELLVIVPRHPKRSRSIQKQLLRLTKAVKVASKGHSPDTETQLFLDDRLGQLMPLFEHAKLVIMGGSFVAKGGHNVLEPALYQKAIITGPDMSDFEEETALLLKHQGLLQCDNFSDLNTTIQTIIDDKKQRLTLGKNALRAAQSQKGVLENYLKALLGQSRN
ncbi:MAG: 3-deoxy-D-manno-octulosonic acid transferase [Pseudomonadota bacterium]